MKAVNNPTQYYDFVLLVGPDHSEDDIAAIKTAYIETGRPYIIIGDGKRAITYDEVYQQLDGKLGPHTRIDIHAHGNIEDGEHTIALMEEGYENTRDVFTVIDRCYDDTIPKFPAMEVHLWSCYGGKAIYDLDAFSAGAVLIAHASAEHTSLMEEGIQSNIAGIKRYPIHPLEEAAYCFRQSPETLSVATHFDGERFSFTARPPSKPLTISREVERYIQEQLLAPYYLHLTAFVEEMKQGVRADNSVVMVLPDAHKVMRLGLLPLDGGALSYYSQISCFVKCGYGDTDYVDAYLEQSQLHPDELKLTDGCTLLILAASNGDNQMVYFLLEKGADPFVKDKNDFTAFHYAAQSKYRSTCDLINEWNIDILVETIKHGNTDKVKELLENQVPANKADTSGVMPLYVAVAQQFGEIVDLLLKENVNPLTTESEGKKVLTLAKEMGDPGIIEALYSKSLLAAAKQNDLVLVQEIFQELEPVPTALCNAALLNAVFAKQVEVARFLLDNGADPNAKTNNGNVIFDSIVFTDSLEMAQLFLSKGADLSIKMQNEDTLLMGAERDGSPQMVQLMTEILQENLLTSTKAGNEAGIRQWIDAGANPNIPGKNGELPLCVASGFGTEACVRVLLELGANPTVQDGKGKNALDAAKEKYQAEIEDLLERNLRIKGDFSRKIVQENITADNQRITGFEK